MNRKMFPENVSKHTIRKNYGPTYYAKICSSYVVRYLGTDCE